MRFEKVWWNGLGNLVSGPFVRSYLEDLEDLGDGVEAYGGHSLDLRGEDVLAECGWGSLLLAGPSSSLPPKMWEDWLSMMQKCQPEWVVADSSTLPVVPFPDDKIMFPDEGFFVTVPENDPFLRHVEQGKIVRRRGRDQRREEAKLVKFRASRENKVETPDEICALGLVQQLEGEADEKENVKLHVHVLARVRVQQSSWSEEVVRRLLRDGKEWLEWLSTEWPRKEAEDRQAEQERIERLEGRTGADGEILAEDVGLVGKAIRADPNWQPGNPLPPGVGAPRADPPQFLNHEDAVESSYYTLGRNPEHGSFGAYADYPKVRENFEKLVHESPDMDRNPHVAAELLDMLEMMHEIGRIYDGVLRWRQDAPWAAEPRRDREPSAMAVEIARQVAALPVQAQPKDHDEEQATQPGARTASRPDRRAAEDHDEEQAAQPAAQPKPAEWWFLDETADFLASSLIRKFPSLEVRVDVQREWLDILDPRERLRKLNTFIVRTLDGMERKRGGAKDDADADLEKFIEFCKRGIEERAGSGLVDGERYLRKKGKDAASQLKDKDFVAGLLAGLDVCGMPPEVWARLKPEIKRLKEGDLDSKAMQCLEWLADLPWVVEEKRPDAFWAMRRFDRFDRFDKEHYGFEEVKNRVSDYLKRRNSATRAPVLCLVGPPGVGKTSVARSIAGALGRECVEVPCNGMREASDVCGLHRSFNGATPGQIIRELRKVGSRNPVFVLDKIDKMGKSAGDVMLNVLDPLQNDSFRDEYLGVPFDLSQVFFVATANVFQEIPAPLQNCLEKIEVAGYREPEKFEIGKLLVKRFNEDLEEGASVEYDDEALRAIVRGSHAEAEEVGVRHLDRKISRISRIFGKPNRYVKVTEKMVRGVEIGEILGPGHDEGVPGVEQLREEIEHGGMPPEAQNQGRRELEALQKQADSKKYEKACEYLKWLVSLPWDEPEGKGIDLEDTRQILDSKYAGLEEAKDRILGYLDACKRGGTAKEKVLCFVGPPGVGKTLLAKNLAKALGREHAVISCGGMSDTTELRGHDRTRNGAQPGRIVRGLRSVGAKNPVLVLDEIDKVGGPSAKGDPSAVLLEILDPERNSRFIDNYIEVPLDLSKVFFVATANEQGVIPPPLRNRMEMIDLDLDPDQTGHDEGVFDLEQMRKRIEQDMKGAAQKQGRRELETLQKLSASGGDTYGKKFEYLQLLTGLPWGEPKKERIDLERARQILDERHYGLEKAKKGVLEYLAVCKRKRERGLTVKGMALCLVGPPGVGKTSLAKSLAKALGRKLVVIKCGGMGDGTELRGHNRTWLGAQPGRIIRELRRVEAKNPVLVLDEIDKVRIDGWSSGGDPLGALLEVLDPEQNSSFSDNYLEVPFDLSKVFFVATANVRGMIPPPLQNRMEMIDLPGYSKDEKLEIARKIVEEQIKENGLRGDEIEFDGEAFREIIHGHSKEVGVRALARGISEICKQVAWEFAKGETAAKVEVTKERVGEILGPGHDEGVPGVEQLREKIEHGGMPPEAQNQGRRELAALDEGSSKHAETLEYLRWLVALPWSEPKREKIDLERTGQTLNKRHCGLEKAKDRILEYLAVRKLNPGVKGPILCFVGPPGTGKTSLAQGIAESFGRKFARVSLGGMSDGTELRGQSRSWPGAQPGRIVRELSRVKAKNPVLVLDEIDKVGGAPSAALLEILDPEQNSEFSDNYIEVPLDLSQVFFIATANVRGKIPPPLRNRMEMIDLPGYSEDEKLEIARKIVERQIKEAGLTGDQIEFDDEAFRAIIRGHSKEVGVRALARGISGICKQVALGFAKGETTAKVEVTKEKVGEVLGPGHDEGVPGVEQLREKIEHGGMSPEAQNQGRRELEALEGCPAGSPEYQKTIDYLRWLVALPWDDPREEEINLERTEQTLDERHFGLREAKESILEYLAVLKRKPGVKGPILCFVGPPGTGKTSLAQGIAASIGREFARVSLGGMRDEAQLRGHSRTYIGAQPGRIVRELRRVNVKNPVLVLDEIDKVGGPSANGDPSAALLEILDPEQNSRFSDNYVEVPLDLSKVFFIATANVRGKIPPPLRNRMEMIDLPGYSEDEKLEIARKIVEEQIKENGLRGDEIEFDGEALRAIVRNHSKEVGVRALARGISGICKRVALGFAKGKTAAKVKVAEEMVGEILGPGHGEGVPGVENLRQEIEHGGMSPEAQNQGRRELEALEGCPAGSPEYQKTIDYLRWLVALPWGEPKRERIDLERIEQTLDGDHSGLEKAKGRILEYMAVLKRKPGVKGPILCFVGPPGVGKTSLAQGIAASIGREFARVSLGGMQDEVQLRGHSRTYIGAQPGRIVRELRRVGVKNPVLVLDEIDKVGGPSVNGDPSAALLEILDPEQNSRFSDNYVEVPLDLSQVFFVATANVRDMIPPALYDRMEFLELPGYTEEEKLKIATKHLCKRQVKNHGLTDGPVRLFTEEALRAVIRGYTREAGVRNLEREIGALCSKVARRRAEGKESPVEITPETVVDMLGAPKYFDEEVAERMKRPGVAIGLSVGAGGGDVLFVEAQRMSGGGALKLTLTGRLKKVMRESARAARTAALTWVRDNAARYDVDPAFYREAEVHLHVPEGAIKKDGPSAGVAMVTALVSELTGRLVRSDLAMTGEITLKGNVLPVGGVKEKVLAARRHGIVEVVLPKQNEKDVNEDLDEHLRRDVRYVSTIDEVLELALLPRSPTRAQ